uniref:Uncharacterized protein n=1 Tax=Alsidium seaforthii TaxID=2007182 RepID=A0A1Z1MCZ4_9FLOR|nr:hypothetical protein [Bryothamnion seaforthii]ARW63880.1 hypothetical protein [Bryothamnion seaforthii]
MAWYMEEALHGTQTITDGCCFELNHVVKSRYSLTNAKYNRLKKIGPMKDLSLGYLLGKKTKENDICMLDKKKIEEFIESHIKKCFSRIKVVNQYKLEIKAIFTGLSTHGASNYQIYFKEDILKTKMRSYKNREYLLFNVEKKKLEGSSNRVVG